jgi:hypothetical protein
VSIAAAYGGLSCIDTYGELDGNTEQQWCSIESCPVAATTTANDDTALIGGIVGGVVGLIALIGVAIYFAIKKRKLQDKQIPLLSNVHEAVSISMVDISSEEAIMNKLSQLLKSDTSLWTTIETLVLLLRKMNPETLDYQKNNANESTVITDALRHLQTSLAENMLLMGHAAQTQDFSMANVYSERVKTLESVLGKADVGDFQMECV